MKRDRKADLDLEALPGHYIRRLQQIAVAIFLQETEKHGVTPVQYAALHQIGIAPGIDQRTLARSIGLDPSTIARGLTLRSASAADRRVRLLTLTRTGQKLIEAIEPDMLRAQQRILEPLPASERPEFMRMLRALVTANNDLSRAPSEM